MAIRAVIFDLFDTLVDLHMERAPRGEFDGHPIPATAGDLHAAVRERSEVSYEDFARALVEVDSEFVRSRYAQGLELPTLERFAALVERLDLTEPELPEVLTAVHMNRLRALVAVPDHHGRALQELRVEVRIGVCSNFSDARTANAVLASAGFDSELDAVVISESVGIRKPRPEIFEAVLKELGVGPREALHVGDSLHADVAGAAALGIRTAWITRRVADPAAAESRYRGPSPDARIDDIAEIPRLLDAASMSAAP